MEDNSKLILRDVKVVFSSMEDSGFGRSITINATDKKVKEPITEWVKENNIGKGKNAGKAQFKEYEEKQQYAFKINDFTRFAGANGLTKEDLGFGSKVSLVATAFEYDNKFGKGISSSLSAVFIEQRALTSSDNDLAMLAGTSLDDTSTDDDTPPATDNPDGNSAISLENIPF